MKKFHKHLIPTLFIPIIFSCQSEKSIIKHVNTIGMEMVKIESGKFTMGSSNEEGEWDEQPKHPVTISQSFYISKTEVTIDQFQKFNPDKSGSDLYKPYITGVSWYEANAFCKWLSKKEGKQYRLPTESEWEYVCRAGTSSPFSTGDTPPDHETDNDWGVRNMHTGVLEWCYDWYGAYKAIAQTDPIGMEQGLVRVIRGGLLDNFTGKYDHPREFYVRSANRAGLPPSFEFFANRPEKTEIKTESKKSLFPGLIGTLFRDADLTRPEQEWLIKVTNSDKLKWISDNDWSACWRGVIISQYSGEVVFSAQADNGVKLEIDSTLVINGWDEESERRGRISLIKGKKYPLKLSYFKNGGESYLRLYWSWSGEDTKIIPAEVLWHSPDDKHEVAEELKKSGGGHSNDYPIGFRVVQAPLPGTKPVPADIPFARQGVKQLIKHIKIGPSPDIPYLRLRYMLPIPLENSERKLIDAAGFHSSFRGHNHSPALEVCSNGDVLLVIYTSYHEYEPGVSLIAARLRFGADQWDMPSQFVDFPDVNDHAPLLWNDRGKLYLFWGNPRLNSAYPFQWTWSTDNGATLAEVRFPDFIGHVGQHSRQPINSAFRDSNGAIYVSSDGQGGRSVLWCSPDDGNTWFDTGGRSGGRHTTFVLLKNGDILGMGGKNTDIDGFMPKSISHDGGRTWDITKTPFPALGSNQRPTLIRLASGRLLFAGDFQRIDGAQPAGIKHRGAYVALSEDEGESWLVKKLPGTRMHESKKRREAMQGETIGYSVARQAPNGIIHLITTMNHPCLHFAMNEAWILSKEESDVSKAKLMQPNTQTIGKIIRYKEEFPGGKARMIYHGGIAGNGRFLLHGPETWFYENGSIQYEVEYQLGKKVGRESYKSLDGQIQWEWIHQANGTSLWQQWWTNGKIKAESSWRNRKCNGIAKCWDINGKLISEVEFVKGKLVQ